MKPTVWGPHIWRSIHYIALAYPRQPTPEDKANYAAFFHSLGHVLPCSTCSSHFLSLLMQLPLDEAALRDTDALFEWTVKVHNRVNLSLGKPAITAAEARSLLSASSARDGCFATMRAVLAGALLLVLALLLALLVLIKWRRR